MGIVTTSGTARTRFPISAGAGGLLLLLDGVIFIGAVAQTLGFGDLSAAGFQVLGSSYRLDAPVYPWILGPLAGLSIVSFYFTMKLRRFGFVAAVALAWVAVAACAVVTGSGPACLSSAC